MRRLALVLLPLLTLGCPTSPCQELGERLCACTGLGKDACKTQVEDQLKNVHPSDATCDGYLGTCSSDWSEFPKGADFCAWIQTAQGEKACGIAQ